MIEPAYSVVIPVYNGAKTIPELISRLKVVFASRGETFEIICVDDGSRDGSWEVLQTLACRDTMVKAARLTSNFGQHNATLCGLVLARGRLVITMDDDLQHLPEDIPVLIAKMKQTGSWAVIARLAENKHSRCRQVGSLAVKWLNEVLGKKPKDIYLSSFRLLDREVVDQMVALKPSYPYFPAMIFTVTQNVSNAKVTHRERIYGASNYNVGMLFRLASRLLINNFAFLRNTIGRGKVPYEVGDLINLDTT